MSGTHEIEYTPEFIRRLELLWGDGFLSPGGPEEVDEIVRDVDLAGRQVLDVGIGTAGPALRLTEAHNAGHITGIDVEAPVLEEAARRITEKGLGDRIATQLVEPGPLPFGDTSFDVVFSKDSVIHIPDKQAFFAECRRVLKPGGWLAISDWFGVDAPVTPEMQRYLDGPLDFKMAPIERGRALLAASGFANIVARDRNAWFVTQVEREVDWVEQEGHALVAREQGQDVADAFAERTVLRLTVAQQGQLRPGHLRAKKPVEAAA
ncbi:MAG: methyltransferase domain-containing protein [Hyphomicrobiaceae bacterium]